MDQVPYGWSAPHDQVPTSVIYLPSASKKKSITCRILLLCHACGVTRSTGWKHHTSLFQKSHASTGWRRGPNGKNTLCNPCGLRWARQKRQQTREKMSIGSLLCAVPEPQGPPTIAFPNQNPPAVKSTWKQSKTRQRDQIRCSLISPRMRIWQRRWWCILLYEIAFHSIGWIVLHIATHVHFVKKQVPK